MSNKKFSVVIYILCSILVLFLSLFIFRIIINNPHIKAGDEAGGVFFTKSRLDLLGIC
jgi:hypothetical protein